MTLIYLASPYSKYAEGREAAFRAVCKVAARLIKNGIAVYSPIAHTHPIAEHGDIDPNDHDLWLPLDIVMAKHCTGLMVVRMQGWEESYGVAQEITWFKREKGIDPIYVDP